ncbi:S-adenosylmethionine carrier 1, chloroplastic/mitochondrial isoform X1 [Physcomitrium patens]|uniref:S-adenosylmethionine transporter n=1 Tax=Physcomitrium patens TaxID=3218 RepID=A0A7I4BNF0_PHYPA|nr:S-adenosylmethionine carrier 1, chloroplastic/mitochondrial-like isoform X1 [Physcomitrium patens]|eukprot:XP_024397817.1 S-adenosylmethionine carrier 1, chloroplastic/mitochondrial-like isoform X1 [Physcomitrella patens]
MAVSMLQLSRSGAHVDVETSRSARHCVGDGGFWNLRKRDCSLHQCGGNCGAERQHQRSVDSFLSRKRCEKLKRSPADRPLLKFTVSSVQETQKAASLLHDIYVGAVAGATAGVVVEAALYPIDTIKTRLQAAHLGGNPSLFKGLYSGLAGNLAGVLPASAVFVGVYEPVKRKLLSVLPDQFSSIAHLTAGVCGGGISSLIRVPTEVVKQRMQTGQFVSPQSAVRQIVAKEGIRGLYAGFRSFLLRDLPFDAFQFCIYEQLKISYAKRVRRELNDTETAFIGAIAGAMTGAVTTPLDVIKTRLMIQGPNQQYKGIQDCVVKIIRDEGAGTLFQGLGPRILWIGVGGSIFFGALEKTKESMEERSLSKIITAPAGYV